MSEHSPQPALRPPHPLALELIDSLRSRPGATVLEVGRGSGRNTRALEAAGLRVIGLDDGSLAAAALSTHALLHGTPRSISILLERIAAHVEPKGTIFVTFGSVRDARYGAGRFVEDGVYAPDAGDELGVEHAYFDEIGVRRLLEPDWALRSLTEIAVDTIAGSWAHQERPLRGAVHWFAIASRPG
jgi:hypothetical protein